MGKLNKLLKIFYKYFFWKVLIVFFISYLIVDAFLDKSYTDTENEKTKTEVQEERQSIPTLTQDQINSIEKMISQGYFAFEINSNEVYINPIIWNGMDYKVKENVVASCAIYCAMKRNSSSVWIDVFDKQSGKKIAKFSQAWGYKVL